MFGENVIPEKTGTIKVGDPITVNLSVEKHGITVIFVHVFTDAIANGGSDSFRHKILEKNR